MINIPDMTSETPNISTIFNSVFMTALGFTIALNCKDDFSKIPTLSGDSTMPKKVHWSFFYKSLI